MARKVMMKSSELAQKVKETALSKTKKINFKKLSLILLLIMCLGSLSYAGYFFIKNYQSSSDFVIESRVPFQADKNNNTYSQQSNVIYPPKIKENPINGVKYTAREYEKFSSKPMITVMIENHVGARPQAGYSQADIVYETLAEGGITRTMAVFWSQAEKVKQFGPIRSARNYFLLMINPYDTLYMHVGCAYSSNPQVNACGNRAAYGIKAMDVYGSFFRVSHKVAPHNAYTKPQTLYDIAKKKDWYKAPNTKAINVWNYKYDAPIDQRGKNKGAKVQFYTRLSNYGLYDVEWKYNPERNTYYRYLAGKAHKDENNNQHINTKVVILQKSDMYFANDGKGRLIFKVIGSGDAFILQDGQVIEATWEKKSRKERTIFYNKKDKKKLNFNRGQVWYTIIPTQYGKITLTK